jgi:N-acetylglutamate synthase-like GNAT family acetyltransferase/nitroimidazol reductase NimA-like FMN-containing flavoprotein (pyridoxamine 5'-phosphate oxidase superfamily)
MRRPELSVSSDLALALLAEAPVVSLAGVGREGQPVLRSVHTVLVEGMFAFHGAPAGEKLDLIGREVVLATDETVAEVPSYIKDPERACPATTFYRSAQVHGRLVEIAQPELRARMLQALMERFQPEGGHVPIDVAHPQWHALYRKAVAGLLIVGVVPERITGKFKLGQDRTPEQFEALLTGLWRRGASGVDRAIELCRAFHPTRPLPAFLRGPAGAQLCTRLDARDLPDVVALLRGQYWNLEWSDATLANAHRGSTAWVGARDAEGRVIASARAISDGAKLATIYDVVVAPDWRGRGLGQRVIELLLDHPAMREVGRIDLGTRDAQTFYAKLGFAAVAARSTRMVRERLAAQRAAG